MRRRGGNEMLKKRVVLGGPLSQGWVGENGGVAGGADLAKAPAQNAVRRGQVLARGFECHAVAVQGVEGDGACKERSGPDQARPAPIVENARARPERGECIDQQCGTLIDTIGGKYARIGDPRAMLATDL